MDLASISNNQSLDFQVFTVYKFLQDETLKQQMNSFLLSTQSQNEIANLDNKVKVRSFLIKWSIEIANLDNKVKVRSFLIKWSIRICLPYIMCFRELFWHPSLVYLNNSSSRKVWYLTLILPWFFGVQMVSAFYV